jgi:long-chain acyl-CoA synthetase
MSSCNRQEVLMARRSPDARVHEGTSAPGAGTASPIVPHSSGAPLAASAAGATSGGLAEGGDRTLARMFERRVERTPRHEAYREFDAGKKRWRSIDWRTAGERVQRFARALNGTWVQRGDRIGVLLPNGLDAVCVDQAAMSRACVPVPMHALDNPASIAYILADCRATMLFAATDTQWRSIAAEGVALPALKWVIVQRRESPCTALPGPAILALEEWLASCASIVDATAGHEVRADDLAAIVYTSGTTGRPKGVMLTHANVVANVDAAAARIGPRPDDVLLSFLPLSHTFERTAGYYLPIAVGCCVAFARSTALLPEDLRTVRPTVLVSVPRIYERVYAQVLDRVARSAWRRLALRMAISVGWRRFLRDQDALAGGRLLELCDDLLWPVLDQAVGVPLRETFGGRLRVAVSGGAALSATIARCFLGLGVPVVQGYGMTETSPVVSANALDDNDPSTVGRPLSNVEIRIGEQQELQVRGPSVMRGYLDRPDETARAFVDGWLRTGDQAAIEGGRIRILGRIKEIIVTATGEKIAPADLELAIQGDGLFEQAFVFGEGRPFIACIVVLGAAPWRSLASSLGLDPLSPGSLTDSGAVDAALQRIRILTRQFPHHGQPRKVVLTLAPWTMENSLMTPTLKLKRRNLEAHFAGLIERLYAR